MREFTKSVVSNHATGVNRTSRGFTLLELMIATSVAAILIVVGIPGLSELIRDNRRTSEINAFIRAVHLSKNEAVKRARYVSLCKSTDGRDCAGAERQWGDGWMIFVNLDRDDPAEIDPDEPVVMYRPGTPHADITGNRSTFTFRPFGKRSTNGTLVFCDARGARAARAVVVSYTGRPRVADTYPDGRPLQC